MQFKLWDKESLIFLESGPVLNFEIIYAINQHERVLEIATPSTEEGTAIVSDITHKTQVLWNTGIKDSENKEVFVGDIVKRYYKLDEHGDLIEEYLFIEEIDPELGIIFSDGMSAAEWCMLPANRLEVLGDILSHIEIFNEDTSLELLSEFQQSKAKVYVKQYCARTCSGR